MLAVGHTWHQRLSLERCVYEYWGFLTYFHVRVGRTNPIIFIVTEINFHWKKTLEHAFIQVGCLHSQATPLIRSCIITLSLREVPETSSKARGWQVHFERTITCLCETLLLPSSSFEFTIHELSTTLHFLAESPEIEGWTEFPFSWNLWLHRNPWNRFDPLWCKHKWSTVEA